jgi:Zn-finger nucleic acid-binding protein
MSKNCSACSAPLGIHDLACKYCLTKADIDIKGVHHHTKQKPETHRLCPNCKINMDTINLHLEGDFLIEQCSQCFSLFFDPGELEFILNQTVNKPEVVNHLKLNQLIEQHYDQDHSISYKPCPSCGEIMNRKNYGARSGVVIDYCSQHGVFLDSGELMRLCQWAKAGGQEHSQRIDEAKTKAAQKRDLQRQRSFELPGMSSDRSVSSWDSLPLESSRTSEYQTSDVISSLNTVVKFIGNLIR